MSFLNHTPKYGLNWQFAITTLHVKSYAQHVVVLLPAVATSHGSHSPALPAHTPPSHPAALLDHSQ